MTLGGHRDTPYNLNALPAVDSMMIQNLAGQSIRQAGLIRGIRNSAVSCICLPKVSSITVFLLGMEMSSSQWRPSSCAAIAMYRSD